MSIVTLTDAAKHKLIVYVKKMTVMQSCLNLKGGGCAGFEYDWAAVDTEADLEERYSY